MIEEEVKKYVENVYHMPLDEGDLVEFAQVILEKFTQELEDNSSSIMWNYGLDSVVFLNRRVNNKESLSELKEKYLGTGNDKGNKDESHGTGTQRHTVGDQQANVADEQTNSL